MPQKLLVLSLLLSLFLNNALGASITIICHGWEGDHAHSLARVELATCLGSPLGVSVPESFAKIESNWPAFTLLDGRTVIHDPRCHCQPGSYNCFDWPDVNAPYGLVW